MKFQINTQLDKIVISKNSLNKGVTAKDLCAKLSHLTGNVTLNDVTEEIVVRFNENDLDNYPEGFEYKVMQTIKENVFMLPLYTEGMGIDIKFDEPL